MRISDWSSDVCSSDLVNVRNLGKRPAPAPLTPATKLTADAMLPAANGHAMAQTTERIVALGTSTGGTQALEAVLTALRSEEHTSELQSLMPTSYASFCLQKNTNRYTSPVKRSSPMPK